MILERLKSETAAAHHELEAQLDLLNPERTRADYLELLKRFYGFYAPLEDDLLFRDEWRNLGFDAASRRKVALLEQDLRALGMSEFQIRALPRGQPENLPRLDSVERGVGALYVLEGATLGGQYISRHLAGCLAIGPESGAGFFTGYGPRTGERWREFRAFCETFSRQSATPDQIVDGALDTFQKFHTWTQDVYAPVRAQAG
jgi:heme oxygenase